MVNLGPLSENTFILNNHSFLNEWQEIYAQNKEFELKVKLRVNYIVNKIYEEFDSKVEKHLNVMNVDFSYENSCYECGANQDELTFFDLFSETITDSNIKFLITDFYACKNFSIIFEGKAVLIGRKFPKKWLFEDFEEELKSCKQAYLDLKKQKELDKQKKKQERLNSKDEKVKLIEELKNKLSPEELELISFKKR